MSFDALWPEAIISGFTFILALSFLVAKLANIHDFGFISNLKDYLTYISVVIVGASYLVGILYYRVSIIAVYYLGRYRRIRDRLGISEMDPDHYDKMIQVWQYGSENLQKEISIQYNQVVLFSALMVSIPILGITSALWIIDTTAKSLAILILIISIFLGFAFFISWKRQRSRSVEFLQAAFREAKRIEENNKKLSENSK